MLAEAPAQESQPKVFGPGTRQHSIAIILVEQQQDSIACTITCPTVAHAQPAQPKVNICGQINAA